MTADALASALMLARKEEEYEAARTAYYKGKGKGNLAELAAEFDAMRTEHLRVFGPSVGDDGDAIVIPLPVDSSAGLKGLGE